MALTDPSASLEYNTLTFRDTKEATSDDATAILEG